MPDQKNSAVEMTFVLPCLNEADTLEMCLQKIRKVIAKMGINAEIVVADNGSTDGSTDIAKRNQARVVHVEKRGYGSALQGGNCGIKW